jgi:ribosomal protein S17E
VTRGIPNAGNVRQSLGKTLSVQIFEKHKEKISFFCKKNKKRIPTPVNPNKLERKIAGIGGQVKLGECSGTKKRQKGWAER